MRVLPTLELGKPIQANLGWLHYFFDMLRRKYEQLAMALNGRISFGDGTSADNIAGAWLTTITPGVAGTDFTLNHNLGRIPVGYFLVKKSASTIIYSGSLVWTTRQITLRSTVPNVSVTVFVI